MPIVSNYSHSTCLGMGMGGGNIADKVVSLRLKIERYYEYLKRDCKQRLERYNKSLSSDSDHKEWIIKEIEYLIFKRRHVSIMDFKIIRMLGRGAFGTVKLVKHLETDRIYALKSLSKMDMIKNDQLAHVRAERDLLVECVNSEWIVKLYCSFQDESNLYLLMEYLAGGDMMTLLIAKSIFPVEMVRFYMAECILAIEYVHSRGFIHRDIKPDNILFDNRGHLKLTDFGLATGFHPMHDTKYYNKLFAMTALVQQRTMRGEIISPTMDKIDITICASPTSNDEIEIEMDENTKEKEGQEQKDGSKESPPISGFNQNANKDKNGNFNKHHRQERISNWRQKQRQMAYSRVGTPDYIAPEVFNVDKSGQGYGPSCDWWSLGAIMYEMIVGYPPFHSESQLDTCQKILNHKDNLQFPSDIEIDSEAKNLILGLLCEEEKRLKLEDLKSHNFFKEINWEGIRTETAPFIPLLSSQMDTSYFPSLKELQSPREQGNKNHKENHHEGHENANDERERNGNNGQEEKETETERGTIHHLMTISDGPFVGYTFKRFDH